MSTTRVNHYSNYPGNTLAIGTRSVGDVVVVMASAQGDVTTSCSDGAGNTYTEVGTIQTGTGSGSTTTMRKWVGVITTGGSLTVTVGSVSDVGLCAIVYTGLSGVVNDYDEQISGSDPESFSLTTSATCTLVFFWASENADVFSSFTGTGASTADHDTGHYHASGDALDIAAGTPSYGVDFTSSRTDMPICAIALEVSGAAAAAGHVPHRRTNVLLRR